MPTHTRAALNSMDRSCAQLPQDRVHGLGQHYAQPTRSPHKSAGDHVCHKHHTCRGWNEGSGPSLRAWQLRGTSPFCGARSSTQLAVCGNQRARPDPGSLWRGEHRRWTWTAGRRHRGFRRCWAHPRPERHTGGGLSAPECAGPRRPSSPGHVFRGSDAAVTPRRPLFLAPEQADVP